MTDRDTDPDDDLELRAAMRGLPELDPGPDWEARTHERWQAVRAGERRRRRALWAGAGLTVAAAATLLLVIGLRDPPADARLAERGHAHHPAIERLAGDAVRRGAPAVGDRVRVAAGDRAASELRVYRDNRLVARCPGDATCRRGERGLELELTLDDAGLYRPVSLSSDHPLPAPGDGGVDRDLIDARTAGARIDAGEPLSVLR